MNDQQPLNDDTPPSTTKEFPVAGTIAGLVIGYAVFACGLFLWVVAVAGTVVELVQHSTAIEDPGLMVVALFMYAAISGVGVLLVRSVLGKRHKVSRFSTITYLTLLAIGALITFVATSQ